MVMEIGVQISLDLLAEHSNEISRHNLSLKARRTRTAEMRIIFRVYAHTPLAMNPELHRVAIRSITSHPSTHFHLPRLLLSHWEARHRRSLLHQVRLQARLGLLIEHPHPLPVPYR